MIVQTLSAGQKPFDPFTEEPIDDTVAVTVKIQIISAQVCGVASCVRTHCQQLGRRDANPVVEVQMFGLPAGMSLSPRHH